MLLMAPLSSNNMQEQEEIDEVSARNQHNPPPKVAAKMAQKGSVHQIYKQAGKSNSPLAVASKQKKPQQQQKQVFSQN